jgi:HEAT repeat protein
MLFKNEGDALKKSHWPRCDQMAADLAAHGSKAAEALVFASGSRTHHVRSACLRALSTVAPEIATELARKLLADKAYEVRETASKILGVPTP